jgi:4-amino-4-deoxy-L-arabinose transferase-like glycosyltransferase
MNTSTLTSATPSRPAVTEYSTAAQPIAVRRWLASICAVALVLRLVAMIVLQAWRNPGAMEHQSIARFIVLGKGFKFYDWGLEQYTSVQSPLFPYMLALFYRIFGYDQPAAYVGVMVLNAVLGAATCAVVYAMVRRLRGSTATGLVAAGLVAVWPTQVYATTFVQAITFITLCSLSVIWLFYLSVDTKRLAPWIAYGLLGCIGALTEPVLLPFMALSGLLILFWPGLCWKIRIRNAAVLFACALAVLGPWTVRNYHVHGKFMPMKSTFWVNMWKGNNPNASGTDRLDMTEDVRAALTKNLTEEQLRDPDTDKLRQYDLLTPEQKARLTGKTEVEREVIFGEYAKSFISAQPLRYLELCGTRFWKTIWIEEDNPKAHGLKQYALYWTPRTILLALTPIGLILAWRRGWRMAIPLLVVGSALLTYTFTIAAARFALPYEPWQLAVIAVIVASVMKLPVNKAQETQPT